MSSPVCRQDPKANGCRAMQIMMMIMMMKIIMIDDDDDDYGNDHDDADHRTSLS